MKVVPPHHDSVATTIWCYMSCIKRVSWTWSKGCLAWSSKSSSRSPSSYPTTSSNTGYIRRKRNDGKNKAIAKQNNQSAQKNVNSFLLNTRVKTKKGKIPSFGFGVMEIVLGIFNDRHKCSNSNLNLNSEEKFVR